jgi:hypothetical protein
VTVDINLNRQHIPMVDLAEYVPAIALPYIPVAERQWLSSTFQRYGGRYPTLEEIWLLMDEVWMAMNCDPDSMDARIDAFYKHPVWLLNGLFIEQHEQSLENRRRYTEWVMRQKPRRIADYGGGFGSLARMIGEACPHASIEIVEPHPHPAAIALAENTSNVRYQPALTGEYDILIATDVFEHVPDPLALVEVTAAHLKTDGQFLIGNCFYPVIKCHLPSTFHFRWSWDAALVAMNLQPEITVSYGRTYRRTGVVSSASARAIERRSRRWACFIERLPKRFRTLAARTLILGIP